MRRGPRWKSPNIRGRTRPFLERPVGKGPRKTSALGTVRGASSLQREIGARTVIRKASPGPSDSPPEADQGTSRGPPSRFSATLQEGEHDKTHSGRPRVAARLPVGGRSRPQQAVECRKSGRQSRIHQNGRQSKSLIGRQSLNLGKVSGGFGRKPQKAVQEWTDPIGKNDSGKTPVVISKSPRKWIRSLGRLGSGHHKRDHLAGTRNSRL